MKNKRDGTPAKKRLLAAAPRRRASAKIQREIRQDLDAFNTYVAAHGSPAALARAHYGRSDDKG